MKLMKWCLIMAVLPVIAFTVPGSDKMVGGIKMPGHIMVGEEPMQLNGAGVRNKYYIDMYVCGLYLKNRSSDPDQVRNANEKMGIRLHIISGMVTNKRMQQAIREGFDKSTHNNSAPFKNQIESLISAFNEPIKKDDVFELHYSTKAGSTVYKNGVKKAQVQGLDFKKALFGIWLGDNPSHKELRDELMKG
jgi:hypothetical protein